MNNTKYTVPTGWIKKEALTIERRGDAIIIEQVRLPRNYSNEVSSKAHDVAYMTWHYTQLPEALAFIDWWLS